MADFTRAVYAVQRELCELGLHEVVERVEIEASWSIIDHATTALGLFQPGNRRRRIIGTIAIPALNLPVVNGLAWCARALGIEDHSRASLRFIVRHEYAHGLAHLLGLLEHTSFPWGRGTCFTGYAETNADEDLAETVATYLTRRGRMPYCNPDVWLLAKWRAAALLLRDVRSRSSRGTRRARSGSAA